MKNCSIFGLFFLGIVIGTTQSQYSKPIFCYWGTWSYYRSGNGHFRAENIDGNLCTHVIYSFFGVSTSGCVTYLDAYLDVKLGTIEKTVGLKRKYPNLKILAAIGGSSVGSKVFSKVAANSREAFATNVRNFLEFYNFDGVVIDWDYPGLNGGNSTNDKENFVLLLRELYDK